MKKYTKRFISLFLAIIIIFGSVNISNIVMAKEENGNSIVNQEEGSGNSGKESEKLGEESENSDVGPGKLEGGSENSDDEDKSGKLEGVEDPKDEENGGPEDPGDEDERKNIKISGELSNNIGQDEFEYKETKKEYENLVYPDDTKIKEALNFKNDETKDFDSENYSFIFTGLKIGGIEISKDEYDKKTIGDIDGLKDLKFPQDVDEIIVVYEGKLREKSQTVTVNIKATDELHGETINKSSSFKLKYTGKLPEDPFKLEGKVVDKDKLKIKILPTEGVSSDKDLIEIEFTGYDIKEGSFIQKDLVDDKIQIEIVLIPKVDTLGAIKFENIHNGDSISAQEFFYRENKLYFGKVEEENSVEVTDLVEIEYTNRNGNTTDYKDKEIYYNDKVKLTVKNENLDKFIKKVVGDNFEYDNYKNGIKGAEDVVKEFTAGTTSTKTYNIDFSRKNYKVKINNGEEKTYNVMADTKYLIFDGEKIESVKINEKDDNLKGSKILIKDLKDEDIINIKTNDGSELREVSYKIQNRVYGTNTKLNEPREFVGLEGTKLIVNPITQNSYKDGDTVKIQNSYVLADSFEKELVLTGSEEVPFYFNINGKIAYRYMYVTKYGDNWDKDLDINDYDIINMKDENGKVYELLVLYKSDVLIGDKNIDPDIKPKDYTENNLHLIDLDESIVLEDEEVRELNMPGSEEFSRIEFVSGPVNKLDKDTLYIYSYREVYKDSKKQDLKIPIKFAAEGKVEKEGTLIYPRLDEEYEITIPVPDIWTCYQNREVNAESLKSLYGKGIREGSLDYNNEEISFVVEAKEEDELKDLFPKLPKKVDGSKSKISKRMAGITKKEPEMLELYHILINYTDPTEDCVPGGEPIFKNLTIQRAYHDGDKLKNISGDWNNYKVVSLVGTDIKLDLNMNLSQEDLKKEITVDESGQTYRFKPYKKDQEWTALVDKNGARVRVSIKDENGVLVDKILGVETERLNTNSLAEATETYYLIYKPIDKPEEETKSYDYTNRYYYLAYPADLIESYGDLNIDKSQEIEEYYREFQDLVNKYYDWEERVGALEENIKAYASENNNKRETIKTLGEILTVLDKNNITEVENLKKIIDEMIKTLSVEPLEESRIIKSDLIDEAKALNQTLEEYIKKEGKGRFKLESYSKDQYFKLDKDSIKIKYRDSGVDGYNSSSFIREPFNDDYEYKGHKYTQYSRIPLSISKDYMGHKEVMDEFMALGDSEKGFDLKNYTRWDEKYKDSNESVGFNDNIGGITPIIYTQRIYKDLKLSKIDKPDPKPPVETGRNLDIIIRNVKFNEAGEKEVVKIFQTLEYRDIPKYLSSLGWTIGAYKDLEYVDDSGQTPALKEGDVKFSEKLEEGKTKIMYIDYVGDGNVEPIEMEDYIVIHSEIYKDSDGVDKARTIENGKFDYSGKAVIGQTIRLTPLNLEELGFKLLDENGNITEAYKEISHEIIKGLNVINIYYKKVESIKYDIKYIDEKGNDLSSPIIDKHIITSNSEFREEAKKIENYKPLKDSMDFIISKDENDKKIIEFKEQSGYEIRDNENLNIKDLYKDGIKVMDLEKIPGEKDNKYIIRFIYKDAITLTLDANGGGFKDNETIKNYNIFKGQIVNEDNLDKASWKNHKFLGWYAKDEKGNLKAEKFDFTKPINESLTLYAKWEKVEEPEPENPDGGGNHKPHRPNKPDEKPEEIIRPQINMLNNIDHFAYIKGYPEGDVRPEGNITREEVAVVFYRLLNDSYRDVIIKDKNNFKDIENIRWSNKEISTLENGKIVEGYEDNNFLPTKYITRAEVAAIASRFDNLENGNKTFIDIKDHWAEKYIISAAEKGWVKGYEDGSFKPDKEMTRAEFVTLVNGVLNRKVRSENILENIKYFTDLEKTAWYYEDVVEASNSHNYEKERLEDGSEKWINLIKDRLY